MTQILYSGAVKSYSISVPKSNYLNELGISDIDLIIEMIPRNNHRTLYNSIISIEETILPCVTDDIKLVEIWPTQPTRDEHSQNIITFLVNYRIGDSRDLFCLRTNLNEYRSRLRSKKIENILCNISYK